MSTVESNLAAALPVGEPPHRALLEPGPGRPAAALRDPATIRVMGPQERVALRVLFADLFAHRDLLHQLAARDVRIRYKQAAMGFAWAILMPILVVGAGTLIRLAVAQMTGVSLAAQEIGAVVLKAFPWAFFAGALAFGVQSVTSNISLVTKIYFPRAVLPIAVVLGNLFDLGIGLATTAVVLPFLGAQLSAALLWVPVLMVLLVVLTAGLCTVLACANLFYRDVKYIVQVVLTFGIFFTPVLFDAVAFGARGARIMMLNPLAPIFEGLRLSVLHGHNLLQPYTQVVRDTPVVAWQPWYLAYTAAWAVGSLLLGLVLFQRTQDLFAEFA